MTLRNTYRGKKEENREKTHRREISEYAQELDEIELLMEAWRAQYTPEVEQETQEPIEVIEVEEENQRTTIDRRSQKRQGGNQRRKGKNESDEQANQKDVNQQEKMAKKTKKQTNGRMNSMQIMSRMNWNDY